MRRSEVEKLRRSEVEQGLTPSGERLNVFRHTGLFPSHTGLFLRHTGERRYPGVLKSFLSTSQRLNVSTSYLLLFFVMFLTVAPVAFAKDTPVPYTLEDRDRLVRVETRLNELEKRIDALDKKFDERLGDLQKQNFLLAVLFTALVIVTIGFAIWDRRTMVRPFETRMKDLEEGKISGMLGALRKIAESNSEVAETLRRFNLL